MFNFISLSNFPKSLYSGDFQHYLQILNLMQKNKHKLFDDFMLDFIEFSPISYLKIIEDFAPYFWKIETKSGEFAGFIYFYDVLKKPSKTNPDKLFSAHITICLERKFFGAKARKIGVEFFIASCKKFEFSKVIAQTFSTNPSAIRLLKELGFIFEAKFKNHTLVCGESVDILNFSLNF